MTYSPGLHLVATFLTHQTATLQHSAAFKVLVDELISLHQLSKVGEVYHDFDGGGYTAVVCLTESHLSVHTWPEYGRVTFDVFLSNYRNNNHAKTQAIYNRIAAYFEPFDTTLNELTR